MLKQLVLPSFFAAFILSSTAYAFRMSPIVLHMGPDGAAAAQVFTLENQDATKVPVQIEVFTRSVDEKGKEVRTPTTDFTIYPEQLVLLPNEKRNVRITWTGHLEGKTEKAYRIVCTQVPVDFQEQNAKAKKAGTNLNFLIQYVASAYVTPNGTVSDVHVEGVKWIDPKNIEVTVLNKGTAHRVLHLKNLIIKSGSEETKLGAVKELESLNVLAAAKMRLKIQLSQPMKKPTGDLQAQLELTDVRD